MLPTVDFCGLNITRLILGANPFGGFSHQNKKRDREMTDYYTVDRIVETWERAEKAGINTMITNNETEHVLEAVKTYFDKGGSLQWIAQVNAGTGRSYYDAIDEVVDMGCSGLYLHGGYVDDAYEENREQEIISFCDHARDAGVPVGAAGHDPRAHRWVDSLDITDFHAVCFFNCGSLHSGKGDRFRLEDMQKAVDCIRHIQKPCIGYKIMGAGRIDAKMAFEYAFTNIKPTDAVNVGMHRGDMDNMVEKNTALVKEVLEGA